MIALCNAGITQPLSLFAAELELRGLPCVQMCTELGYPLAAVTASNYVPGLPIVVVQRATGDEETFGKAETERIAPEVASGLTSDPATLLARFRARLSAGNLPIAEDGTIRLPPLTVSATDIQGGTTVEIDPGRFAAELYEELCAAELCDGLPVIPPTVERVEAMLGFTDLDPEEALVSELPPSGASVTVRALAVNAVMAGCRPEYFPILVAAFQAIADPTYRAYQGAITTHPAGNAVIVSGPLADQLGIHSGYGCLGPGFRANATIGRAVNLTIMNVARAIPGKTDLSTFGSPAEFTSCFAESDKGNPWQPLHTELYGPDTTSVTVHKCEGPHNVLDPCRSRGSSQGDRCHGGHAGRQQPDPSLAVARSVESRSGRNALAGRMEQAGCPGIPVRNGSPPPRAGAAARACNLTARFLTLARVRVHAIARRRHCGRVRGHWHFCDGRGAMGSFKSGNPPGHAQGRLSAAEHSTRLKRNFG